MANNVITIREILKKSPEERKQLYQASGLENKNIDKVTIDGNTFTDYSAFSFLMEKSYVKSPTRSADGSIPDLDTYAWFLTPHLKIDFSLMSIDSYRAIMTLLRSKNEFIVTCYDVVEDKDVTHNMYFATEQMPKLWTIAKALNGGDPWVELLGVSDYTVELIGTNTDFEEHTITYRLNVPSGVTWEGDTYTSKRNPANLTTHIGASLYNGTTTSNGEENYEYVANITFGDNYQFAYWSENPSGIGVKYYDGFEYLINRDMGLWAIWSPIA